MAVLSLQLDRDQKQVSVCCDGADSHSFALADIVLSKEQAEQFISDPSNYGQRLYAALFAVDSRAADALAPGQELYLHLASELLNDIPWEYAFDGRHWIAAEYGLARTTAAQMQPDAPKTTIPERLRFLFIPSDPLLHNGQPVPYHLGLEDEWEDLVRDLRALDPAVDLIRVTPPTHEQFQESVAGMEAGIVHFTGHGAAQDGKAWLMFEQPCGVSSPVEAERFVSVLGRRAGLVLLSACQSAVPGRSEEANLAALLSARGIPSVIGMQLSVPDLQARRFTDTFYHFLFSGEPLFEAMRQARLRILEESSLVMGIPVLYVSAPSMNGNLRPKGKGLAVQQPAKAVLEGLPTADTGFVGRQKELADIGIHLTAERKRDGDSFEARSVTLHGIGGIGKTALLVKASQRFAWAFPDGVIAIPLEPMPATLDEVMVRLEKSLSLPEGSALSTEDRQARLLRVMQSRKLLLALDNFETIFKARDEGTAEQKETALLLYDFFAQIPARGPMLLISSREVTDLPGERIVDVTGLTLRAGAQLFKTLVSSRKSELTDEECLEISGKVEGHPLALKLLAPLFDRGEGKTLADFTAHFEENLRKASKKMAAGRRQDTLQLCFDFSLAHLKKTKPELVEALARLTMFHGSFSDWLAAPVIFGKADAADKEGVTDEIKRSTHIMHELWEYGQIEREVVFMGEETISFYGMHPALRPFAAMHLGEAGILQAEEGYIFSLRHLAEICYPGHAQGGIHAHRVLAVIAYKALPDFRRAGLMKKEKENAILCFHGGYFLRHFGDLAGAMGLYQQSLEINEGLGDLKGKAATLHEMAGIHVIRGDLAGAMGLYQQSLEIDEGLGDLKGKAMSLGMMGQVLSAANKPAEAIHALMRGFLILAAQQMEPETQKAMATDLRDMRQQAGAELFDPIWQKLTEGAPLPEWLTR